MRIYVNIVGLWWTCVIEDVKSDDMLFDKVKCNDELCANISNWNCDICYWVLLCWDANDIYFDYMSTWSC